jgi:hypothetical protein
VGQDCADQLYAGIVPAFRTFIENARGAREAQTGKRKGEQFLSEKGLSQAWSIYTADYDFLSVTMNGYNVWCTMPSGMSADKGDRVAFKATLTPSDTDTKFAFGKRPTVVAVPQGQLEKLPQGDGDEQDEQPQDTDPENIYGLSSIAQSIDRSGQTQADTVLTPGPCVPRSLQSKPCPLG